MPSLLYVDVLWICSVHRSTTGGWSTTLNVEWKGFNWLFSFIFLMVEYWLPGGTLESILTVGMLLGRFTTCSGITFCSLLNRKEKKNNQKMFLKADKDELYLHNNQFLYNFAHVYKCSWYTNKKLCSSIWFNINKLLLNKKLQYKIMIKPEASKKCAHGKNPWTDKQIYALSHFSKTKLSRTMQN